MAVLGQRLVDLHLLKSPELDHPSAKYQGQGNDQVISNPVTLPMKNGFTSTPPITLKILSRRYGDIKLAATM
jgi:hypothetical protein